MELEPFLPCFVLLKPAAYTLSSSLRAIGVITWLLSRMKDFTVKDAHAVAAGWTNLTEDKIWKTIWSLDVQQMVKVFLWELTNSRLITNEFCWTRSLAPSPIYAVCLDFLESCIHMVRDCHEATEVWKALLPSDVWLTFFSHPLKQWVEWNLSGNEIEAFGKDWGVRMEICYWLLWR